MMHSDKYAPTNQKGKNKAAGLWMMYIVWNWHRQYSCIIWMALKREKEVAFAVFACFEALISDSWIQQFK